MISDSHRPAQFAPRVSIIMGTYNCGAFLSEAIESVIAQSFHSWELIVVDDGSTDDTFTVLTDWVGRDSRIKYIQQGNSGRPGPPRNVGIAQARGDILTFLDGDDVISAQRLARVVSMLDSNPDCDVLYHDYARFEAGPVDYRSPFLRGGNYIERAAAFGAMTLSSDGTFRSTDLLYSFFASTGTGVLVNTIAIRRKALKRAGTPAFKSHLVAHEDVDLWLRLAEISSFIYLDEALSGYRYRSTSILASTEDSHLVRGIFEVKSKALQRCMRRLNPVDRQAVREHLADAWSSVGWRCAQVNMRSKALYCYCKALSTTERNQKRYVAAKGIIALFLPKRLATPKKPTK